MEDLLTNAELLVERDRRGVAVIGLNVDHRGVASRRNLAQLLDQGRRDAPPSILFPHREVVDLKFWPRPFELVEFVCDQSTENLFVCDCDEDDNVLFRKQVDEIRIVRRLAIVDGWLVERSAENSIQRAKEGKARRLETTDRDG